MAGTIEYSNGVGQSIFSIGTRCWVRVSSDASGANPVKIGMIDSMRGTKNIQLQRANVCGAVFPASIDPQAVSITVNLTGFIASPATYNNTGINGAGGAHIATFNPKSSDITTGKKMAKYAYMDFYDDKKGLVLASFKNVVTSSYTVTVQGGSYSKADVALEATDMSDGEEFLAQTDTEVSG